MSTKQIFRPTHTGTPDWESLRWEVDGYLSTVRDGFSSGDPIPVDEYIEQAEANGWDGRTVRQQLDESSLRVEDGYILQERSDDRQARANAVRAFGNAFDGEILVCPSKGKHPVYTPQHPADVHSIDDAYEQGYFVSTDIAADRIESGQADEFYVVCGDSRFGTENVFLLDYDDPDTYLGEDLPTTLRVQSGSGEGYHDYFIGDVAGAKGLGVDLHTSGNGAVIAGSSHPSGGVYTIEYARRPARLEQQSLPSELRPTVERTDYELTQAATTKTTGFTNQQGISLEACRILDSKLDDLLTRLNPVDYDSRSEADMATVERLRFHQFDDSTVETIIRQFRDYEKTRRDDYLRKTLGKSWPKDEWEYQDSLIEPQSITATESPDDLRAQVFSMVASASDTVVSALMSSGKTYSVARHADESDEQITYLTRTNALKADMAELLDERGVNYHILGSALDLCETATDDELGKRFKSLYDKGISAAELHRHPSRYFGVEELPCDGCCSYKQNRDFDPTVDVLIGHYKHGYITDVVADRAVFVDEQPIGAFIESFRESTVDDWNARPSPSPSSYTAHSLAPVIKYARSTGDVLSNGWLYYEDDERTIVASPESDDERTFYVLNVPDWSEADRFVGLDGTACEPIWKLVNPSVDVQRAMTDDERADYLRDVMGYNIVALDGYVRPVSSENGHKNLSRDRVYLEQIVQTEDERPSVISSKNYLDTLDDEMGHLISGTMNFARVPSNNDFADDDLLYIGGSSHYGDGWIEMLGAFDRTPVARKHDTKGNELAYEPPVGNAFLREMRENVIVQSIFRVARSESTDRARIFLGTSAYPEWLPVDERNLLTDSEKQVRAMLEDGAKTTSEIADDVSVSVQSVRSALRSLPVESKPHPDDGRKTVYELNA